MKKKTTTRKAGPKGKGDTLVKTRRILQESVESGKCPWGGSW